MTKASTQRSNRARADARRAIRAEGADRFNPEPSYCIKPECEKPVFRRGLCSMHTKREQRAGMRVQP